MSLRYLALWILECRRDCILELKYFLIKRTNFSPDFVQAHLGNQTEQIRGPRCKQFETAFLTFLGHFDGYERTLFDNTTFKGRKISIRERWRPRISNNLKIRLNLFFIEKSVFLNDTGFCKVSDILCSNLKWLLKLILFIYNSNTEEQMF